MNKFLTCAALIGAVGIAVPAQADGVKVGTLTCHQASGFGLILGSTRSVRCIFSNGEREGATTAASPRPASTSAIKARALWSGR